MPKIKTSKTAMRIFWLSIQGLLPQKRSNSCKKKCINILVLYKKFDEIVVIWLLKTHVAELAYQRHINNMRAIGAL